MSDHKSFYDFDYLIEIGEKRIEQYTGAYQLVVGRLTNIILVYSIIGIYVKAIIQDWFENPSLWFTVCVALLIGLVVISIVYTIKLLVPVNIAYLQHSKHYYEDLRLSMKKN